MTRLQGARPLAVLWRAAGRSSRSRGLLFAMKGLQRSYGMSMSVCRLAHKCMLEKVPRRWPACWPNWWESA